MLEGLLVDLVPYGKAFLDRDHVWWNNESAFWGMAGGRMILSKATLDRWHAERANEPARSDSVIWFGIRSKSGVPLGDIELADILPHHRVASIGVGIGEPEYWGSGYGTDALLLLVEYAFAWLDYRKLWLETMDTNIRMQRAAQKAGFREEARRRRFWLADGQWIDNVLLGIQRDEWPGRDVMVERMGLRAREETK